VGCRSSGGCSTTRRGPRGAGLSDPLSFREVLGRLAADPAAITDRFSSTYLVALAADAIRDIAAAQERASASGRKLATFSLQSDIRFASAANRHAFAEELANAVAKLISKYHDDDSTEGRNYRLLVGSYPARKERSK
jgi:hypothetical protein